MKGKFLKMPGLRSKKRASPMPESQFYEPGAAEQRGGGGGQ